MTDPILRKLAQQLNPPDPAQPPVYTHKGTVLDVAVGTPPTITVSVNGKVVPGVRIMRGYYPLVNDEVTLLKQGGDLLALGVIATSMEERPAIYTQTSAQSNAAVSGVWTRQEFPVASNTSPMITPNGAFNVFTVNYSGYLEIEAAARIAPTSVNSVRYLFAIYADAFFGTPFPFRVSSTFEPEAALSSVNLNVHVSARWIPAGTTISVGIRKDGVLGGGGGTNSPTEMQLDQNSITFKRAHRQG